jgi:8-oxo-dGTP pyrophosphatase MutT (NUDIX family)
MVSRMEGEAELDARHGERGDGPRTVAPARPAATVILLRGAGKSLEVLLVKRTPRARFMGGVWVFPGGAVDREDALGDPGTAAAHEGIEGHAVRNAALRELREEAGIELADAEELTEFSRWITPSAVPVRFDTHFFLARLPDGQEPRVDGQECVDQRWLTPRGALAAHRSKEIALVFPTIKHLEQLAAFDSVDSLIAHTRGRPVLPVQPRVVMEGEVARVLLPGDPGY